MDEGDEMEFERWLERFEERSRLAKWTEDTKLCQLKLHLSKVADHAFQMLPKDVKSSCERVTEALKKRFRLVEIEELKSLEFHRHFQEDETVQELRMDLQKLARKAFPSMEGKEFDCMLKGRFYQALHPRWQWKLNAPKPDETFGQLFERARMLEQHEKQLTASAASRGEKVARKAKPAASVGRPPPSTKATKVPETPSRPPPTPNFVRLCHVCHQPGHLARNCPERLKNTKQEAPGRSTSAASRTSCVEVETIAQEELTEEELEFLLACCRLQKEKQLLVENDGNGTVASVEATQTQQTESMIGPLFYCDLEIERVPVTPMVDCGSQTTIISPLLLHRVDRQQKRDGNHPLELKMPTVRLYGKDAPNGVN